MARTEVTAKDEAVTEGGDEKKELKIAEKARSIDGPNAVRPSGLKTGSVDRCKAQ